MNKLFIIKEAERDSWLFKLKTESYIEDDLLVPWLQSLPELIGPVANERMVTHAEGCHTWGSSHYECATRRIAELEAQLADAQKDAARINWISHQYLAGLSMSIVVDAPHDGEYRILGDNDKPSYGKTFREAIDAAMQPKEQP